MDLRERFWNYEVANGPFSRIDTRYFDYFPDSLRDSFNFEDYNFKDYAEKVMQYQRRFCYLAGTGIMSSISFRSHGFAAEKIQWQVEVNLNDDFEVIRKSIEDQCQKLIEAAKQHKSDEWHYSQYPSDYLRDANGKKIPPQKLFALWDKCIEILVRYQECGNKSKVSADMGMFNYNNPGSSVDQITNYLEHAERLITSAIVGTFLKEGSRPLTAGKIRKEKYRKEK